MAIKNISSPTDEMKKIAHLNKGVRYYVSSEEALANYAAYKPDFEAQP